MKRFHVIVSEEALSAVHDRAELAERLTRMVQGSTVNPARFQRHGILTLDVPNEANIELLRAAPEVEAVEIEGTKRAS